MGEEMARRRGRPRKLCIDKYPEFFKVYIPDRSSQQLRVPPAFIKHFNGTIPSTAILKDLSGKVWPVDMEKVESSLFIKNGWQSFVSDHSLELGEFLVFRYNGDSLFDVTIYGINACKRDKNLAFEKTAIHVKTEEETEAEEICTTHNQFPKRKYSEIGYKSSPKEETAEECEVSDAAELVLPKNPYFIGSVSQIYPYTLEIPRRLVGKNGIELKPKMWLCDQSGKSWTVRVCFRKDGRVSFAKGWKNFWKDNRMRFEDKCIFEFAIVGGRRASRKVQVKIIRAKEGNRKS